MKKGVDLKIKEGFMVVGDNGETTICIDPAHAYDAGLAQQLKMLSEANEGCGGKAIKFRTPEEAKLIV